MLIVRCSVIQHCIKAKMIVEIFSLLEEARRKSVINLSFVCLFFANQARPGQVVCGVAFGAARRQHKYKIFILYMYNVGSASAVGE